MTVSDDSVGEGDGFFKETARSNRRSRIHTYHSSLDRSKLHPRSSRTIIAVLFHVVVMACLLVPSSVFANSPSLVGEWSRVYATYSRPVDLDHLREATMIPSSNREGASKETLAFLGELRVGSHASVRVGYETSPALLDGVLSSEPGTIGADVEYSIGQYGTVQAGVYRDMGNEPERSGANIGVGYRFGDHASVSASYSMLRFDYSEGAEIDRLGEAKLVVRF